MLRDLLASSRAARYLRLDDWQGDLHPRDQIGRFAAAESSARDAREQATRARTMAAGTTPSARASARKAEENATSAEIAARAGDHEAAAHHASEARRHADATVAKVAGSGLSKVSAPPRLPPSSADTNRATLATRLTTVGGTATREDAEIVAREVAKLPSAALEELDRAGVKVVAGRRSIVDVMPKLRGVRPRGWPPGTTWEHAPGVFQSSSKRVVVCTDGGRVAGGHGSVNLAAHEIGHALDYARGDESAKNSKFAEAYRVDREQLSAYYRQDGGAGLSEAYAESFAAYVSGDRSRGFQATVSYWEDRYGRRG